MKKEHEKIMRIYSGKCLLCDVGHQTGIVDCYGKNLRTGDIVVLFTKNDVHSLTVLVADQYQSYSDGSHVEKENTFEFYVMGIRSVNLNDESSDWSIKLIKKYEDVVNGEHWSDWGFCFREEPKVHITGKQWKHHAE